MLGRSGARSGIDVVGQILLVAVGSQDPTGVPGPVHVSESWNAVLGKEETAIHAVSPYRLQSGLRSPAQVHFPLGEVSANSVSPVPSAPTT